MKRTDLPDYKKKQRLLYMDKTPGNTLSEFGNRYFQASRISDALEFGQRAGDRQLLTKIASLAEESGDVMVFQQAHKTLESALSPEDWNRIGEKAFSLKKFAFASYAFERAGNAQRSADTAEQIKSNPVEPTLS